MKRGFSPDGRRLAPERPWRLSRSEGRTELRAPSPGYVRDLPPPGTRVGPGDACGVIEVLGVAYRLRIPEGAAGFVAPADPARPARARTPVVFDEPVLVLEAGGDPVAVEGADPAEAAGATGHVLRAPSSGRFYRRPSPDAPPFVEVGATIRHGDVVGLLEVMKTFSRLAYEGAHLPSPARVVRIVPADGDDVDEDAPILEVEPEGG